MNLDLTYGKGDWSIYHGFPNKSTDTEHLYSPIDYQPYPQLQTHPSKVNPHKNSEHEKILLYLFTWNIQFFNNFHCSIYVYSDIDFQFSKQNFNILKTNATRFGSKSEDIVCKIAEIESLGKHAEMLLITLIDHTKKY